VPGLSGYSENISSFIMKKKQAKCNIHLATFWVGFFIEKGWEAADMCFFRKGTFCHSKECLYHQVFVHCGLKTTGSLSELKRRVDCQLGSYFYSSSVITIKKQNYQTLKTVK
jgi:hypothetical protein